MEKFDILVMGELNIDLILDGMESLPRLGAETLARRMTFTLGSSSAIFASNAAALGAKVAFLGKVGRDEFGDFVIRSLKDKNVSTELITAVPDVSTGATVVLNVAEDRSMVTYPGAMERLDGADLTPGILRRARHLHVASVFLQPRLRADLLAVFRAAKEAGLTTSLDPQWDPAERWDLDLDSLLPYVDVFMPNEAEALALTGARDLEGALSRLSGRGEGRLIVVKLGGKGSLALREGTIVHAKPFSNDRVVDAIGAGDSFGAGFIRQFLLGSDLSECLRFGNLSGALNTTAAGGTGAFADWNSLKQTARERFGVEIEGARA